MNPTTRGPKGTVIKTRAPMPPQETPPPPRTHGTSGPTLDADWQEKFIAAMLQYGVRWKAARVAGISTKTVNRYEEIDPVFSERIEDAHQEFVDNVEVEFLEMGRETKNPLPYFGILKRHRPLEWNDRLAVNMTAVDVHVEATADQAKELLAMALGLIGPATRQALMSSATVIDVTPTALSPPPAESPAP